MRKPTLLSYTNYTSIAVSLRVQTVLSLFLNCFFLCYGVNKRTRLHATAEGAKQKILPNQRNLVIGIYLGSFQILDWILFEKHPQTYKSFVSSSQHSGYRNTNHPSRRASISSTLVFMFETIQKTLEVICIKNAVN